MLGPEETSDRGTRTGFLIKGSLKAGLWKDLCLKERAEGWGVGAGKEFTVGAGGAVGMDQPHEQRHRQGLCEVEWVGGPVQEP